MKLKLSISRKVGAPGYGSDGASAEVEVEIDGTPTAIQAGATIWYTALEQAVAAELARLRAAHPQPQPAAEPAPQRSERPPARRPEPGWDDERETPRNGQKPSDWDQDPPRTGSQLRRWSVERHREKEVSDWGKRHGCPSLNVDWSDQQVQDCFADLAASPARMQEQNYRGRWGRRS